jgi:hypothetical protein
MFYVLGALIGIICYPYFMAFFDGLFFERTRLTGKRLRQAPRYWDGEL